MDQVLKVLGALCNQISTPRALAVKLLAENGEWAQLQKLRCDPSAYLSSDSYYRDVIVTDILRKCSLPGSQEAKYRAAVETFYSCERMCFSTNRNLDRFIGNYDLTVADEPVIAFVRLWRKKIESILGHLPQTLTPKFSTGATYADNGKLTTIPDKITNRATLYPGTRDLLPIFWQCSWGRVSYRNAPREVPCNVFFSVPKDATKDRGCCKEASFSLSLQLDVGALMKLKLKASGIDLRKGKELHMEAARTASLCDGRATLDMSNASDTVAKRLVELVLASDWYSLLDSLRAPSTQVDGKVIRLEKFSSMGNGFTFELETLIFLTLAQSVCEVMGENPDDVMCYGDDLIVPARSAALVLQTLRYFGFEPNTRKSFTQGRFRESCGGDYFDGEAVRPHYLDNPPTEPQHWISLANGLWRLPQKWASSARNEAIKNIPKEIRSCQGPESLGDIVLHGPVQYWSRRMRRPKREFEECAFYRAYTPIPDLIDWKHWKPEVVLACTTLGLTSDGVSPRSTLGHRLSWVREPGNTWLPMVTT